MKMRRLGIERLAVHCTHRHIYAQVISADSSRVLTAVSTLSKELEGMKNNIAGATRVGELVAARARVMGVEKVAFDRSGFKYHGRVKALAEGARRAGLSF